MTVCHVDLCYLINEPTNITGDSMSCIHFTMTYQPAYFVENGVRLSLDNHCQNQLIFGKLNITSPFPALYRRMVWEYPKANIANIRYM